MPDHFIEVSELAAFYIKLLSERQKEIVQYYYFENLSLTEIAENLEISRNAVYDALQKAEKALYGYEDKLHLVSNYRFRMAKYAELESSQDQQIIKIVNELKNKEEDYE